MQYGMFDDVNREYVITTPKTPLPWINYLGSEGFFSLVSNTGGGYSFYKDAKLRRLTRYRYNGIPADTGSRFYYINDGACTWSPGYLPAKTELDSYRCRHGLGYTVIESEKDALACSLTLFVPLGFDCELNYMKLTNHSDQEKSLTVFSAVEWCLWNAVDDAQNFQRNLSIGEIEQDGSTIYHKTEYRERRNHYAFFHVNADAKGFDTDRDSFLGPMGDWNLPAAVKENRSRNSLASGWSPIASQSVEVILQPGESTTLLYILGYAENDQQEKWEGSNQINKSKAKEIIASFSTESAVLSALDQLSMHWTGLLEKFSLRSGYVELDRMMNIWHPYQCMVTFLMSRSASYFESGTGRGMGFRDSCQDLLGFVHLIPHRARRRILDIASIQFEDGSTYHQYQPLTKRGNADVGSGFNDDPLWLVACTAAYIRETGDSSILEELVPFDNQEGSERPLFEHLRRSITYTIEHRGPHGLPLIGRADWNDCLNLNCFSTIPGESFQTCANFESGKAESVLIAAMFVLYGREYTELCKRYGKERLSDYGKDLEPVQRAVSEIETAVLEHGWDGNWFLRAYDAFENPVGSQVCEEGQIFIEPQGFCVMAGIGVKEGYAAKALMSVKERLEGDHGIQLLNPCYTRYHEELGEITSYPPGYKENGGIFCHNNPWVSIAHTVLGDGNAAFDAYRRISPAYTEYKSDVHRTEPYIYSQMIAGRESSRSGEAKNSWLTGTASWAYVNISQYILGIKAHYDGLEISPCLPDEIDQFEVVRNFRGTRYNIRGRRTGVSVPKLLVNGTPVDGNIIPANLSSEVSVEVEY
ncbi:glycosyl transferase [Anoxybacterium hadale]|uniref:Glycosyl transferase n=1 Tax=Anoxybacterium hadale TaxID=3408580 RepID=A0ACD1ADC9_9FIRM|nr:glycosyl transferase [Clostridiales bacterium]